MEWRRAIDLDEYDLRWETMAKRGDSIHGELDFVDFIVDGATVDVLDAGCGTGRLAIEAARRGHRPVGVDLDRDMIERARRKSSDIEWIHADLTSLELDRTFDVIVMAGNIPLFCGPRTQPMIVSALSRHLRRGGSLICGFSIEKHADAYTAIDFDRDALSAGLSLVMHFSTWDRHPARPDDEYAVVVYGRD